MKRCAVAFFLCLVLALGGVVAGVTILRSQENQVTVTMEQETGDRSVLQGLTARETACQNSTMGWRLTIPLETPEKSETECFRASKDLREGKDLMWMESAGVEFRFPDGFFASGDVSYTEEVDQLWQREAERTDPGKSHTETVRVADVLETLPLEIYFHLPEQQRDRSGWLTVDLRELELSAERFFRFPPPPELEWEVTVRKDASGQVIEKSFSNSGDNPYPDTVSAVGEDRCFFTLVKTMAGQNLPDFSLVPGGYGIYALDYNGDGQGNFTVEGRSLRNVCPLPEDIRVMNLFLSPDETELFLLTWREGQYTCTILDAETMEEKQSVPIPVRSPASDASPWGTYEEESDRIVHGGEIIWPFLEPLWGENALLLFREPFGPYSFDLYFLSRETEGRYVFRFAVPLPDRFADRAAGRMAAWNGEKLAVGVSPPAARSSLFYEGEDVVLPGLELLVYDGAGTLLWRGTYRTSLTEPGEETSGASVQLATWEKYTPTLHWENGV